MAERELKTAMVMVGVQAAFAGVNVLYKLAAEEGMNLRIIVAYRFLFASAFLVPLAFFFRRKTRPRLTWMIIFEAFLCGLFGGSLAQNLYVESLALTSATFASAMTNLVPPLTFVLALSFRMERLNTEAMGGKAKLVGTLISLGGAMVLTFYKGNPIHSSVDLLHQSQSSLGHVAILHGQSDSTVMGALLALGSCSSYALWLIIQARISEKCPCHYTSTAMMCVMGAIQAVIYALCVERDWSQWTLGWNVRLLTVTYSGIVASGMVLIVMAWCVRLKGPLYVSVFNPIMLFLVVIAAFFLLNENLYWGSLIGGILIVGGLYMVLWGKSKEMSKVKQTTPMDQSFEKSEMRADIDFDMPLSSMDNKISSNNSSRETTANMMIVIDPCPQPLTPK